MYKNITILPFKFFFFLTKIYLINANAVFLMVFEGVCVRMSMYKNFLILLLYIHLYVYVKKKQEIKNITRTIAPYCYVVYMFSWYINDICKYYIVHTYIGMYISMYLQKTHTYIENVICIFVCFVIVEYECTVLSG